ncbi:Gfo/Idh/MocA family oxidoreductase [Candidatus Bipolaricaulota bacterium]|nr:Gfo/Idh/MocA family oxidoreductase [Candidatus Bipolaricaulota bacterium]
MNSKGKAKWGILGTAKIAREALVPGIRDANNSELAGIASRSKGSAEKFAERFDVPNSYGSYEELLEDEKIDFVYIPLPNHLHGKWSREAARHGKHVLCEKPLGATAEEVEKTFEVAERQGVTLMEGFMYRFHPQVRKVKELLKKGEIGEPRLFRGAHSFSLITRDREDDIRWKEEMDGGSLMDLGTYSVNTVRYLFDEEPNRVFARDTKHPNHSAEAETQAILEFPGSRSATIDSSFLLDHRANYELVSEAGKIQAFNTYAPGLRKETKIEVKKRNVTEKEILKGVNEYALEVEGLVNSVKEGTSPLVDSEDSINNAKVLEAIRESVEKEKWVELK